MAPSAISKYPGDGDEPPKIRIMILETDDPHPEIQDHKGSYSEMLHHHFTKAGRKHRPPLGVETDRRFVVAEKGGAVPKPEEFDGVHSVLITGSMFDADSDEHAWILDLLSLLRELFVRRPDIKFSGVCFGHQLLCRLLGAPVGPSPKRDWEIGHSAIHLTDVGRRIFRTDAATVYLHQMHQGQVKEAPSIESEEARALRLPRDARVHVWGWSEHTRVQGVYVADRVFTTQAHLAFDDHTVHREIDMRVESGGIQDLDHARRAKETAHWEHDGEEVAAAILRFFHGEDREIYEDLG
ncbi:GMP synthase [Xylariomycetidae sp. FL2044]|nr:GMP synthase [Xylariomycetidae sp. FL2044]